MNSLKYVFSDKICVKACLYECLALDFVHHVSVSLVYVTDKPRIWSKKKSGESRSSENKTNCSLLDIYGSCDVVVVVEVGFVRCRSPSMSGDSLIDDFF